MKCVALLLCCFPLAAQWTPLGPFGGPASIVVADPYTPRTFLAGTRNGLIFRSNDAGESWIPLPFPAQLQATLNALAIDPQIPGVYLAALSSEIPQHSGILRSTDAGATWHQIPELRNERARAIAFKRANSKFIAVGTETGVFASQDGGETWHRISSPDHPQLRPVVALTFDPRDPWTIYAGTPHLPWKTTDGGSSWNSIATGMIDDSDVFSIQVDRNHPQRVFASACSGIYRSVNGAASWTRMLDARDASYRTYTIVQDLRYENIWFAGTTHGLVRSVDNGVTWQKLGPFATRSIAFDPGRPARILIATDEAGLLRSDDNGETWHAVNAGFCNRRVSALWTSAGAVYATILDARGQPSVLRLAPDFTRWTRPPLSERKVSARAADVRDAAASPDGLLAATTSLHGSFYSDTIQAICRHPRKPWLLLAAKFGVIYASRDGGRSWKRISHDGWPIRSVTQLIVLPGSPDRLLVLTFLQGVWELPLDSDDLRELAP